MAEYDLPTAIRKAYEVDNKLSFTKMTVVAEPQVKYIKLCSLPPAPEGGSSGASGIISGGSNVGLSPVPSFYFSASTRGFTGGNASLQLISLIDGANTAANKLFSTFNGSRTDIWFKTADYAHECTVVPLSIADAIFYTRNSTSVVPSGIKSEVTAETYYHTGFNPRPNDIGASKGIEFNVNVIPAKWTRVATIYSPLLSAHNLITFTHTRGSTVFGGTILASIGHPDRATLSQLSAHNYNGTIIQPIFRLIKLTDNYTALDVIDNAPLSDVPYFEYVFSFVNMSGVITPEKVQTESPANAATFATLTIQPNEMVVCGNKVLHTANGVEKGIGSADLNTLVNTGIFKLTGIAANSPSGVGGLGDYVINMVWDVNAVHQMYFSYTTGIVHTRMKKTSTWSAWRTMYDNVNAIGAGGIIESGSNASGTYLKFLDGTMICYLRSKPNSSRAVANKWGSTSGNGFATSSDAWWTFPAVFASPPLSFGNIDYSTIGGGGSITMSSPTTTKVDTRIWTEVAGTFNAEFLAIGRWK